MIAQLLYLALASQAYYTPQEAEGLFNQANEAYSKEDYAGAKENLLKLLSHGQSGPDVLYNLGTTCLAANELGEAVLYLERAKRAGSSAPDIDANLALARSRQMDQIIGGQMDEPFIQRLAASTLPDGVAWAFLGLWWIGFGLLFASKLKRLGPRGWFLLSGGVSLACALSLGLVLAVHAYVRETVAEGVVLAKTLSAREFPKDTSKSSFEMHAGLKIRLLEDSGSFVRIRLPNGLEGWAHKDGVAKI